MAKAISQIKAGATGADAELDLTNLGPGKAAGRGDLEDGGEPATDLAADNPDPDSPPARADDGADPDEGAKKAKVAPPIKRDRKRNEIGEKADRIRLQQIGEVDPDDEDDDEDNDDDAAAADRSRDRQPAADDDGQRDQQRRQVRPAARERDDAGDDPLIEVKVDGRVQKRPLSEIVASAQQHYAAENRLDQLNSRLDQLAGRLDQRPTDQTNAGGEDQRQPGTTDPKATETKVDKARLRDLAEQLQTGDPEDGEKSLSDLIDVVVEAIGTKAPGGDDVSHAVSQALLQRDERQAALSALDHFQKEYPTVAEDPRLVRETMAEIQSQMLGDLKRIGVADEELRVLARAPEALREGYNRLRRGFRDDGSRYHPDDVRSWNLRNPTQLISSAADAIGEWSGVAKRKQKGKPSGADTSESRRGRKEGLLNQPTSAATRGGPGRSARLAASAPRQVTVQESRKEGFAQIAGGRAGSKKRLEA